MPIIIDEGNLIKMLILYAGIGFGVGLIPMVLVKISPGWKWFTAWITKKPLVLEKRQDGVWQLHDAKYDHGFYIAKKGKRIYQPVTDGTDIGMLQGVRLGVTSESFGATISPEKAAAVELWKQVGFVGFFEAELFDYYVKNGKVPELEHDVLPGVTTQDLYNMMRDHYGFERVKEETIARLEQLKQKIPTDEKYPVFWKPGPEGGLFANVGRLVDYGAIKNFQVQYLRPDLVSAQIKAHVEARVAEETNTGAQAIKFIGVGVMVFLIMIGAMLMLRYLGLF